MFCGIAVRVAGYVVVVWVPRATGIAFPLVYMHCM